MKVDRIKIYGGPGTGKTSLAIQLSEKLNFPVYHLDDVFWEEDWQEMEAQKFKKTVADIVEGERWIIDGNYSRVKEIFLPRCTLIIILKTSLLVTFWRLFVRSLARRGLIKKQVTELPKNIKNETGLCKAIRATFELAYHGFKFKHFKLKKLTKEIIEIVGKENVLYLKNNNQIKHFLQKIN